MNKNIETELNIATVLREYENKWVGLSGNEVIAAGNSVNEVKQLAENIVQITNGKLYAVRNLEELDQIVLQDYYSL